MSNDPAKASQKNLFFKAKNCALCILHCALLVFAFLLISSCTPNPVTGKRQVQLYTEQDDLTVDADLTPLLIAAGYGSFNDPVLADYITAVGQRLIPHTHRPNLPYRFILVNAPSPAATALPGGTLILSRGLIAQLQNEAQLAALLAHNLAHINARDPNTRLPLRPAPSDASSSLWDGLVSATGVPPAIQYTHAQERLADAATLAYLLAAGYDPREFLTLLELLDVLGDTPWNTAHPNSPERLADLRARLASLPDDAPDFLGEPEFRQATLLLRSQRNALLTLSQAKTALLRDKNPRRAITLAEQALRLLPNDYAGNLILANALNAAGQVSEARYYARLATSLQPDAPAAFLTLAQSDITDQNYSAALSRLDAYATLLPRNNHIAFYQGLCHEALGQTPSAAAAFTRFLRSPSPSSAQEDYARRRLTTWSRERR